MLHWGQVYGLPVASIRIFNAYGPRSRTTGAYGAVFGVFLAHVLVTFPYMLGAVKPVLDELEITYEEAAYTMGAGRLRTFVYVVP